MTNWKDIFNKEAEVSDEELLKYLNHDISEADMHAIEEKMAASDFHNDAIEGLQEFKDKKSILTLTNTLNQQLKKQIVRSGKRKKKRKIQDQQWMIVVVLSVLFLSIIGYLLIHYYR
jgi:hypothetical protein